MTVAIDRPGPVSSRYTDVAIILHWVIATLVLANIMLAWNFGPGRGALVQLHKSFGITVLLLSLFRLGWRLTHPVPALPSHVPMWQRIAARATHWLFYAIIIGMPLSGWAMSTAEGRSVILYGVLPWPEAPVPRTEAVGEAFMRLHGSGALLLYLLLAVHVAAAMKHLLVDRDGVFGHIWPWARRPAPEPLPTGPVP